MEDAKKKRLVRHILLILGTLIVVGAVVLIVWLVDKNDVAVTHAMGEPVQTGRAEITVDGVVFSASREQDIVTAQVFITLEGKADLSRLQVAGGEYLESALAVFKGEEYAAAPQGKAESGKYALTFTAVAKADAYLYIGKKDKVFLGTAIVLK